MQITRRRLVKALLCLPAVAGFTVRAFAEEDEATQQWKARQQQRQEDRGTWREQDSQEYKERQNQREQWIQQNADDLKQQQEQRRQWRDQDRQERLERKEKRRDDRRSDTTDSDGQ
ncbi:MAG: hypothetical protein V3571_04665 [Pseudodesulfovibrio sp.]